MKVLFYLLIIFITALFACTKSASGSNPFGTWRLVQEKWSLGPNAGVKTPSSDSTVTLTLSRDNHYSASLNGNIISEGGFSITTDSSDKKVLELNNFQTTGIFSLFTLYQIGTNGQVASTFDGLYMTFNDDGTMNLSSAITPGSFTSYTFARN